MSSGFLRMFKKTEFRIRKLEESDSSNVRKWRNQAHVREVMYTDHEITVAEHEAWIIRALNNDDSCYLILERNGSPQAFINFTSIDQKNGKCFWGYYLISPHNGGGIGSVMAWFSLDWCFRVLGMRKLFCESLASNRRACSLYRKFSFTREAVFRDHVLKDGAPQQVLGFSLLSDEWSRVGGCLAGKLFS